MRCGSVSEDGQRYRQFAGKCFQTIAVWQRVSRFDAAQVTKGNASSFCQLLERKAAKVPQHSDTVSPVLHCPPNFSRQQNVLAASDRRLALLDQAHRHTILSFFVSGLGQERIVVTPRKNNELFASVGGDDLRSSHQSIPSTIDFAPVANSVDIDSGGFLNKHHAIITDPKPQKAATITRHRLDIANAKTRITVELCLNLFSCNRWNIIEVSLRRRRLENALRGRNIAAISAIANRRGTIKVAWVGRP
jgi:hypothetical protein